MVGRRVEGQRVGQTAGGWTEGGEIPADGCVPPCAAPLRCSASRPEANIAVVGHSSFFRDFLGAKLKMANCHVHEFWLDAHEGAVRTSEGLLASPMQAGGQEEGKQQDASKSPGGDAAQIELAGVNLAVQS